MRAGEAMTDHSRIAEFLHATGMDDEGVTSAMIKVIGEDEYVAIKPLLFHWTMIRGSLFDVNGYDDRWCYANRTLAEAALAAFPTDAGADYEPEGWHRHPRTGRRRENADPDAESFAL